MFEGICPKCGCRHSGWALQFERYQSCPRCGTSLNIFENGKLIARGYSPFEAPEYIIDTKKHTVPAEDQKSNS